MKKVLILFGSLAAIAVGGAIFTAKNDANSPSKTYSADGNW